MEGLQMLYLACAALSLCALNAARAEDAFEYGSAYRAASVLPANLIAGNH